MSSLAARRKQRAYRKRLACGIAVLRVPIQHHELAEALIASGRLSIAETLDRRAVEHEVALLVEEWRRQWDGVC
jgi:hypothetical protein